MNTAAEPTAPTVFPFRARTRLTLAALALAALGACTPAPIPTGIDDPDEAANRRAHAFNREVDRAVLRPAAQAYGTILPEPARIGISNVSRNLDMPRIVVNGLLQGNPEDALHNTFRFLVNSTFGFAGLLDPATDMGLDARDTDFGETLHVWGVPEGRYRETRFFGPSTQRDSVGSVVDLFLNPLRYELTLRENLGVTGLGLAARVGDRYRFSNTVDSILYESEDSYAQARLLYLQNRRFRLGGSEGETFEDPYDDPYGDAFIDPYAE
jgi:phospholipid-binding lipoprotein MlaA